MKILVVCDLGINRSHTLKTQLQFLGNDVLVAGAKSNSPDTLSHLLGWADMVICTDDTNEFIEEGIEFNDLCPELEVWTVGPDVYPRPFNSDLLHKAKEFIYEHPELDNRPLTTQHPKKGIKDPNA